MTILIWLPLLLALVTAVSLTAHALLNRTRAQSMCYQAALHLQVQLREKLNSLLKLNPRAARLQKLRAQAETHWRVALATGQPALIAAATAERTALISAQVALRVQQELLFQQARLLRQENRIKLGVQLPKISAQLYPKTGWTSDSLAVFPSPPLALAPVWKLRPDFTSAQGERVFFSVTLFKKVGPWNFENLNIPQKQNAECGATLKPRGSLFQLATLGGKS